MLSWLVIGAAALMTVHSLAGCTAAPAPSYVAADQQTYNAIAPEYQAYVNGDVNLSIDERAQAEHAGDLAATDQSRRNGGDATLRSVIGVLFTEIDMGQVATAINARARAAKQTQLAVAQANSLDTSDQAAVAAAANFIRTGGLSGRIGTRDIGECDGNGRRHDPRSVIHQRRAANLTASLLHRKCKLQVIGAS